MRGSFLPTHKIHLMCVWYWADIFRKELGVWFCQKKNFFTYSPSKVPQLEQESFRNYSRTLNMTDVEDTVLETWSRRPCAYKKILWDLIKWEFYEARTVTSSNLSSHHTGKESTASANNGMRVSSPSATGWCYPGFYTVNMDRLCGGRIEDIYQRNKRILAKSAVGEITLINNIKPPPGMSKWMPCWKCQGLIADAV